MSSCGTAPSTTRESPWRCRPKRSPTSHRTHAVVRFESIRRFKGLERPVVILCELDETGERFDQLLYTGMTRATAYLVVIAAPDLARVLRRET